MKLLKGDVRSAVSAFLAGVFVLGTLVFQTGCATILGGRSQDIEVTSSPPGAKVFINGEQRTTTPGVISLQRRGSHILRIEREGYEPIEMKMRRSMSGWILADILYGAAVFGVWFAALLGETGVGGIIFWNGLPPLGIDLITGAAFKQLPDKVHVELLNQINKK